VNATSKGGTVTVKVTDAGDPVAGSRVSLAGRTLQTNAKGEATANLPAGSYKIGASKARYVGATTSVKITTKPS